MTTDIRLLAYAALLTWVMIMVASLLKSGGDLAVAFGNRDTTPPQSALAGRADRAAKNMLENLVLFVAVLVAAHGAHHGGSDRVILGARLFFWGRLAYWFAYLAGVKYLRTGLWAVAVAGMGLILATVF